MAASSARWQTLARWVGESFEWAFSRLGENFSVPPRTIARYGRLDLPWLDAPGFLRRTFLELSKWSQLRGFSEWVRGPPYSCPN